ncbi:hypothetical protein B9G69_003205 [Bdellovibrio sp. SKB1291214]|uniref:hypothetical protein n=1 Tax=Bdellovibrio sp. SKB1291214 TaxID=1732569 RepID=UPI000B5151AC|nr:hypothetical protein [Bdellovibrio sp. SKB1291214]UYL09579.1 hypothetical protein B9G69_003205 [Bdellovibrio sp. SKB1291214]
MKHLLLIVFATIMGAQAQASVSADEFVDKFVAAVNRRLVITNQDRIMENKTIYCTGMRPAQIEAISKIVRENTEITVQEFSAKAYEAINCYPTLLPQLKRKGWGVLTKSLWKDVELVNATLADLGVYRHRSQLENKLLDSLNP